MEREVTRSRPDGGEGVALPIAWQRQAEALSAARLRNLLALPPLGVRATVSEMRHKGATGSGMDLLHGMGLKAGLLCARRWVKWGDEDGQKRGEGYEYSITERGSKIRQWLTAKGETT